MWKICAFIALLAGCGSNVEQVQAVGSGKSDYRRSPCACFQLRLIAPNDRDGLRRGLSIERALG